MTEVSARRAATRERLIDAARRKYEAVRESGGDRSMVFPDWAAPSANDRSLVYDKGAYVMHRLRLLIERIERLEEEKKAMRELIRATVLAPGERIDYRLVSGRLAYVQLIRGQLEINGKTLNIGDGAKIANETDLQFLAGEESEFLLFDLPPAT